MFPFATVRKMEIAGAPVLAQRLSYVGELGWELYVPSEYAVGVFDDYWRKGTRMASDWPGCMPWTPAAWRQAFATGGTT